MPVSPSTKEQELAPGDRVLVRDGCGAGEAGTVIRPRSTSHFEVQAAARVLVKDRAQLRPLRPPSPAPVSRSRIPLGAVVTTADGHTGIATRAVDHNGRTIFVTVRRRVGTATRDRTHNIREVIRWLAPVARQRAPVDPQEECSS